VTEEGLVFERVPTPTPGVFLQEWQTKGLGVTWFVRVAGKGLKVAGFSVGCEWPARVSGKEVSGGQLTVESLKLHERGEEER
jgi:hypothetical protein